MSDLTKYGISLEVKTAMAALNKFKKASQSFNKQQETALKNQIKLQQQLNKLQGGTGAISRRSAATMARGGGSLSASKTLLAERMKAEEVAYDKTQKSLTKRLEKEEKERTRISVAEAKRRIRAQKLEASNQSARRIQAVSNITAPSGAESMKSFYQEQEKSVKRLRHMEAKRLVKLRAAKKEVMNSTFMLKRGADATTIEAQEALKLQMASARTAKSVKEMFRYHKNNTAQLRQQNFLMRRMRQSSEQFAGNMVSVFAVAAGGATITRIGQDFEAVNNTMLAVSGSSEKAGENLKFVKEEAFRLGVDLKQASKQYAKMVAAQGEMSDSDLQNSFKGLAEMSTVLGLSADESGRAFTALTQIMSKGQVMAEELKGQLGEVMPNALQIMAKSAQDAGISVDGSVKSLMKLMEQGKVMADDVMPHFARNMRLAASAGLDKAMNSNRVAMNRMVTSFQVAADDFFKSGYGEGLTDVFNSIGKLMKENSHTWKALGKIMGSVLKAVAFLIENILNPILSALGSILHAITTGLGEFSGVIAVAVRSMGWFGEVIKRVWKFLSGGKGVFGALTRVVKTFLLPLYAALAVLEELAEFLAPTGKKTLIGTNITEVLESSGILKIVDRIEGLFNTISEVTSKGNGQLTTPHGMASSTNKAMSYMQMQAGKNAPLVLKGDVYLNSESVGQQVLRSEAASSEIDTRISGYLTGNR